MAARRAAGCLDRCDPGRISRLLPAPPRLDRAAIRADDSDRRADGRTSNPARAAGSLAVAFGGRPAARSVRHGRRSRRSRGDRARRPPARVVLRRPARCGRAVRHRNGVRVRDGHQCGRRCRRRPGALELDRQSRAAGWRAHRRHEPACVLAIGGEQRPARHSDASVDSVGHRPGRQRPALPTARSMRHRRSKRPISCSNTTAAARLRSRAPASRCRRENGC